jgi:hypothetical protein
MRTLLSSGHPFHLWLSKCDLQMGPVVALGNLLEIHPRARHGSTHLYPSTLEAEAGGL